MSEDYSDLVDPSLSTGKTPTPPEKEPFKSLYIRVNPGKNHVGIQEQPQKLNIRGFDYNLDKVHMIIMMVKKVLVNRVKEGDKEVVKCFCYKSGQPDEWYGISGRKCGKNKAERQQDPFCATCKEEMIVGGIYCDENGKPIKEVDEDFQESGKPVFVFIRGKGIKYKTVSEYISELMKVDFEDPVFDDEVLEKQVANRSRVVTEVTVGTQDSSFSTHFVFNLQQGKTLSKDTVKKVLKIAKNYKEDFDKKFDWSKTMSSVTSSTSSSNNNQPDPHENDGFTEEIGANFETSGGDEQPSESSTTPSEDSDPFSDYDF